jgi:hypothetical protein
MVHLAQASDSWECESLVSIAESYQLGFQAKNTCAACVPNRCSQTRSQP